MSSAPRIGRPAGADGEQTRRRIMDVAMAHIADVGYASATMKTIAREAGVTSAAIYHYFGSKHELVRAILASLIDEVVGRLDEAAQIEGSLPRRFTAVLEEAIACTRDYPAMTRFATHVLPESVRDPQLGAEYARRRGAEEHLYGRLVDDATAAGELPAGIDRQAVVDMLTSITAGLTELSASASPKRHQAAVRAVEGLLEGSIFS